MAEWRSWQSSTPVERSSSTTTRSLKPLIGASSLTKFKRSAWIGSWSLRASVKCCQEFISSSHLYHATSSCREEYSSLICLGFPRWWEVLLSLCALCIQLHIWQESDTVLIPKPRIIYLYWSIFHSKLLKKRFVRAIQLAPTRCISACLNHQSTGFSNALVLAQAKNFLHPYLTCMTRAKLRRQSSYNQSLDISQAISLLVQLQQWLCASRTIIRITQISSD